MPVSVNTIAAHVNLNNVKSVNWGATIQSQEEGVYIISLSEDPSMNHGTLDACPLSVDIIRNWLDKVGGFELDGIRTFNEQKIAKRLSEFWLPDENILYIGKAPKRSNNKGIGNRVKEFYRTDYGEAKPHAGGHWLKALKNLNELYVYYAETPNSGTVEMMMLNYFCDHVSRKTLDLLRDRELPLPFANLELIKGKRKKHGLNKMKKC